jgi:hypothetical protein
LVTGILFVIPISWASAATVHVANNGLDSSTCGSFTAPCRSIGRGLDNARADDTVLVQPGRYGDLDRDGVLGGVGEETPDGEAALRISKPVKVLSTNGAVSTVIDGGSATQAAVEIASSNVTFGGIETGFTLIGGRDYGLFTDGFTNVRISGNVVRGAPSSGMLVISAGAIEVSDNVASDNPINGISAVSRIENGHVLVRRNKVYSNGTGISVAFLGSHEVSFNEMSDNGVGLSVDHRPTLVFRNLVTGNRIGIIAASFTPGNLPATGPLIVRNTLIANSEVGILLTAAPVRVTLRENNFYGNGLQNTFFPNCGIANVSNAPVSAANSYWGAPTGPGADPADVACGSDPVVTTPFARAAH